MKTYLIKDYRIFEGSYNTQMPKLIKSGLQPLTAKDVMQYKVKSLQSNNPDEINFWLNKSWDTVSRLVHHDGKLIILPNLQLLYNITPEQFKELSKKYEVLQRNKIIYGKPLNEREAKENSILIELAEGDKVTLSECIEAIFAKAKKDFSYNRNMAIYLPNDRDDPTIHTWSFRNLYEGSSIDARIGLFSKSRLLGFREQDLERIIQK